MPWTWVKNSWILKEKSVQWRRFCYGHNYSPNLWTSSFCWWPVIQTGSMVKAGSCEGNVYILLCRSTRYFAGHWTNVPLYPDLWVWCYCLLCNLIINYLSFTYLFILRSLQFVTVNILVLSLTEIVGSGIPSTPDPSMTHGV